MPTSILATLLLSDAIQKVDFFADDTGLHPVRGSSGTSGERKGKGKYKPTKVGERHEYAKPKRKK